MLSRLLASDWVRPALVVALLALIPMQTIPAMLEKTFNVDEANHLYRGYIYIETGKTNFPQRLNQIIEAAFVKWFVDPKPYPSWLGAENALSLNDLSIPTQGRRLIFGNGPLVARNILFYMRLPFILLSVATGALLFRWARQLYGTRAAFVALTFYVFSPNMLTHSRYALSDFCGAIFMFATMYCLYRFLDSMRWRWLLACGVGFGLAELSKESQLLLIPVMILLTAWHAWIDTTGQRVHRLPAPPRPQTQPKRSRVAHHGVALCLIFLVGGFVIWTANSFEFDTFVKTGSAKQTLQEFGLPTGIQELTYEIVERVPVPAPNYFRGVRDQVKHAAVMGHNSFLAGEHDKDGWWYFFLYLYSVKSPLPILIVVIVTILSMLISFRRVRFAELFLILPPLVFFAVTAKMKLNIGIRHALPVFPFLFVLGVRIFADSSPLWRLRWVWLRRAAGAAVVGLCLWTAYRTIAIFPHHESYFNELVGGPEQGYKIAVDSNLDWGQDLQALKRFMDVNGLDSIFLAYYGSSDPDFYGIRYVALVLPDETSTSVGGYTTGLKEGERRSGYNVVVRPVSGYVAISSTHLQAVFLKDPKTYQWLMEEGTWIGSAGHSIQIYELRPRKAIVQATDPAR